MTSVKDIYNTCAKQKTECFKSNTDKLHNKNTNDAAMQKKIAHIQTQLDKAKRDAKDKMQKVKSNAKEKMQKVKSNAKEKMCRAKPANNNRSIHQTYRGARAGSDMGKSYSPPCRTDSDISATAI